MGAGDQGAFLTPFTVEALLPKQQVLEQIVVEVWFFVVEQFVVSRRVLRTVLASAWTWNPLDSSVGAKIAEHVLVVRGRRRLRRTGLGYVWEVLTDVHTNVQSLVVALLATQGLVFVLRTDGSVEPRRWWSPRRQGCPCC